MRFTEGDFEAAFEMAANIVGYLLMNVVGEKFGGGEDTFKLGQFIKVLIVEGSECCF